MKQILQNLRTGETQVVNAPIPKCQKGQMLIQTHCTLISVGTERMLVEFGKSNLLNKARQQPDKVKMVLDKIKTDGLFDTLEAVKSKLDMPLPLGYCNVGTVVEVGPDIHDLSPGDRVASNGHHAEFISVSRNLCTKIPDSVDNESAAFTVIGAIALQGIRLANPTLGETIVVMGLGLIGLLTVQLLIANGCKVISIDYDSTKLTLAKQFGAEIINLSEISDPVAVTQAITNNQGVDAVIIAAATKSNDPVHQAATMCRKRGRIILVGVVGLELSRADFYEKELTFQVSCSYGPGRYDKNYEERNIDYPFGLVRWTENRNLSAVLELLSRDKINVTSLITHRYSIETAIDAYKTLNEKHALGIVLQYPQSELASQYIKEQQTIVVNTNRNSAANPIIGFLGAGNYAARVLIPAFAKTESNLKIVVTNQSVNSVHAAKKFNIERASTDNDALFQDPDINIAVIATRHNTHADLVIKALQQGKHVFVEKPLVLRLDELENIKNNYEKAQKNNQSLLLMIGFNRRFSPMITEIKKLLTTVVSPKSFIMTVNAGQIPIEHWTQDKEVGGGRMVGECCHFVDLLRCLVGHKIIAFQVQSMANETHDTFSVNLSFSDGSIGTIHYFANGNKSFAKERLEIFCQGKVLVLDNFRKLYGHGWKNFKTKRLFKQNKGQQECVDAFIHAVKTGGHSPIPFDEIYEVSKTTIDIATTIESR